MVATKAKSQLTDPILACLNAWLGAFQVCLHRSGANNQGYLITADNQSFFLKCYPNAQTSNIRIEREIAFIDFCLVGGYKQIAQVRAFSLECHCVLFEFIDSDEKIIAVEHFVAQAMDFIRVINRQPCQQLPNAAEAAFTVDDFKNLVKNRFEQLEKNTFPPLFATDIQTLVTSINDYYQQTLTAHKSDLELFSYPLASPSDFGLHNALLSQGDIYYIDFEYAGKDSLWKLFADFCAQPQYPINLNVVQQLVHFLPVDVIKVNQANFCFIYQLTLIKWSLLMIQTGLRLYSDKPQLLCKQLVKVSNYFDDIDRKSVLLNHHLSAIR